MTLPLQEYGGQYLWVEAHGVVAELLSNEWRLLREWVTRDAGVSDEEYQLRGSAEGAWHRLQISLSAATVWAHVGPWGSYKYLLRAITCLLAYPVPEGTAGEEELIEDIERCVSQLIERIEESRPGYFRRLLEEILAEDSIGWDRWREVLERLDMLSLLPPMPVSEEPGQRWHNRMEHLLSIKHCEEPERPVDPFD